MNNFKINTVEHYLETMYIENNGIYTEKDGDKSYTLQEIYDKYQNGLDENYLLYLYKIEELEC
jgi:hypothetical protein